MIRWGTQCSAGDEITESFSAFYFSALIPFLSAAENILDLTDPNIFSWYFGAMSRQDATDLLMGEREGGVFLVRDSATIQVRRVPLVMVTIMVMVLLLNPDDSSWSSWRRRR